MQFDLAALPACGCCKLLVPTVTPRLNLVGRMHGAGWHARTADLFETKRIDPARYVRKTGIRKTGIRKTGD